MIEQSRQAAITPIDTKISTLENNQIWLSQYAKKKNKLYWKYLINDTLHIYQLCRLNFWYKEYHLYLVPRKSHIKQNLIARQYRIIIQQLLNDCAYSSSIPGRSPALFGSQHGLGFSLGSIKQQSV